MVPDDIIIPLIEARIKQSDCKVNGWIMEGFPQTTAQIHLLKSLKIKPSLLCMFEQPESETIRRLKNRRMDPETGLFYNLEIAPPSDETVARRLYEMSEDKEEIVKQRIKIWQSNQQHVEDAFKEVLFTVQADQSIDQVTEVISDVILNPIF